MAFAPISTTAIIAAALAAFVFGALWYTALSRPWMAALASNRHAIGARFDVFRL